MDFLGKLSRKAGDGRKFPVTVFILDHHIRLGPDGDHPTLDASSTLTNQLVLFGLEPSIFINHFNTLAVIHYTNRACSDSQLGRSATRSRPVHLEDEETFSAT